MTRAEIHVIFTSLYFSENFVALLMLLNSKHEQFFCGIIPHLYKSEM